MAAARFPAKTPARTAAAKAHHLPVSEARSGRGRGGVSSRLADTFATRPEEGGVQWLREKAEQSPREREKAEQSTCEREKADESVCVQTRAEAACEKTCWRGARGRRELKLLARRCAGEAHVAEDVLARRTWQKTCLRGARVEDVLERRTWRGRAARHAAERGTCLRGARNERREAVVLWVDAQKGSCDSFLFLLLGLCVNACGRCQWGLD